MKIKLTSVMVDDQAKALAFYTDVLGFEKKHDVPVGEHRWLTIVSPADPDGAEILLDPDEQPAAKPCKAALVEDGIPFTPVAVEDIAAETRAPPGGRRPLHAGANRHGHGNHRCLRRHLQQPDSDRADALSHAPRTRQLEGGVRTT